MVAIAASIAVGTSKGLTLIFDYHQNLTATIGLGTRAVECGSVTSLAVSADHSTITCGHAKGHIFTWELSRPAKPFLLIEPLDPAHLEHRRGDGHVSGTAIVHVGFLGTRHTALVSADEGGMAFSHLATRGLGAVARFVKTTRILGRYPTPPVPGQRPRKASSVLAFSPLPLGNVEQPTDAYGLTALLTPYLLVIVSTTPIAETQFKTARPKEIAPHSMLSGCLAWFPAVKLKKPMNETAQFVSKTKLVYCWSNILTVLDVDVEPNEDPDQPPILHFRPRSRWKNEEAIVAVQWLHRSVLGVLTISQRLIILEDTALRVTDTFDLIHKHIYHQDLFSKQLRLAVEQLDENDSSMHGVVADAFHMSFRAYKGRLFLLGFNDISIGTLSNWADRLMALMEAGDFIAAIQLATSYYTGDADKISVGLPEDNDARHALVQEKLLDMITASLKYTFSRDQIGQDDDQRQEQQKELAVAAFTACMPMQESDFLFDDVYSAYEEADAEAVFFEVLEPYILDEVMTAVPPEVLKDLITHYASNDRTKRLEELICRLDTSTMDIHQVTTLCKSYRLYDALIYVWNQAIGDYVTPLIELMYLIRLIEYGEEHDGEEHSRHLASSAKVFPYLAYALTGRVYPSGVEVGESEANHAKAEIYNFLFSGRILDWPLGSQRYFRTRMDDDEEPPYPYLSLILRFDTGSFLSMLNEAFEDHFLNGAPNQATNGFQKDDEGGRSSSLLPTRQSIISMLQEVLSTSDFDAEDRVFLNMFIARNLPKFPQFIVLPGKTVHSVLEGLCQYPSEELAEDCQLSVEYLLSFYHPPDLNSLIPLFRRAEFFRVLKSVYRSTKQHSKLLQTYFEDPQDRDGVFETIGDTFRSTAGLAPRQVKEVESVIIRNATALCAINTVKAAQTLQQYAPHLIQPVLHGLDDGSQAQFVLLRTLLEPSAQETLAYRTLTDNTSALFEEHYVRLMCTYNPTHVADYVGMLRSSDLRLNEVLPAMEKSGVVDAAVVLMTNEGMVQEAMDRLVKHLRTLEAALIGLINAAAESPDASNTEEAAEDILENLQKYVKVGIWLCQGQTRASEAREARRTSSSVLTQPAKSKGKAKKEKHPAYEDREANLTLDERLWLDLIDTVVAMTKEVTTATFSLLDTTLSLDAQKLITALRMSVQSTFTALLTSTTRPQLVPAGPSTSKLSPPTTKSTASAAHPHPHFLPILRAFLARASARSPSLSDLRAVLSEIFAAYAFEETLLALANQFLDKDLFARVDEAWRLRQRGWRPRGNVCERCRRRVWGPGAGPGIWVAWEKRSLEEEAARKRRVREAEEVEPGERGKGRAVEAPKGEGMETAKQDGMVEEDTGGESAGQEGGRQDDLGPLVVFACRHVWHRNCLEAVVEADERFAGVDEIRCPLAHPPG